MSGLTFGACCSADIQRQLLPHETWTDRPDVVNAVFKHKLKVFLLLLEGGKPGSFFPGKQVFIFQVIEWQKRGLPHCKFPSPRPRSPTVAHFPPFVMLPDAGHIAVRILVTGAFNHFDHVSACIPMVSPYSAVAAESGASDFSGQQQGGRELWIRGRDRPRMPGR